MSAQPCSRAERVLLCYRSCFFSVVPSLMLAFFFFQEEAGKRVHRGMGFKRGPFRTRRGRGKNPSPEGCKRPRTRLNRPWPRAGCQRLARRHELRRGPRLGRGPSSPRRRVEHMMSRTPVVQTRRTAAALDKPHPLQQASEGAIPSRAVAPSLLRVLLKGPL